MPPIDGVKIHLGARDRRLRFDNAALERLQAETVTRAHPDGMPLGVLLQRISEIDIRAINTALWVGLLHADPELERADVVRMVDTRKLITYGTALARALQAAISDEEGEGEADAGAAPARGKGKSSST